MEEKIIAEIAVYASLLFIFIIMMYCVLIITRIKSWKQLTCKHKFKLYCFSAVECEKCGWIYSNKKLATKLIYSYCDNMVNAGLWDKADTNNKLRKYNNTNN